jgi:hypothetical protein
VNEYGINIQLPPTGRQAPAAAPAAGAGSSGTCATTWQNASACMIEQALKYAKLSRFSPGEGSATGWISYRFEAQ